MPLSLRQTTIAVALSAGVTLMPASEAGAVGPITDPAETIGPVTRLVVRAHARALERNVHLKRTNTRLKGRRPHRHSPQISDWSIDHLRESSRRLAHSNRRLRRAARRQARREAAIRPAATTTPGNLEAIAACESGGNPSAVDASGTYRGKYQFDRQTWASVGGSGDPAAASEAEQDQRAAALVAQSGSNPWPVCGG